MLHFLKGHYTFQYFENHNNNPKLKEIYERTLNCEICLNDQNDYLKYVYEEIEEVHRPSLNNHVAVAEENTQIYLMKAVCNRNYYWIKDHGIVRRGPFFYRQNFGILVRFIPEVFLKMINKKISYIVESGLVNYALEGFRNNAFGYVKNVHPEFKRCISKNEISNLDNSYRPIRIENIQIFMTTFLIFYFCLILIFIILSFVKCIQFAQSE